MDDNFDNNEKLYRAVYPNPMYWKNNGKVSSAAFKDKKGLSVERDNLRDCNEVVTTMSMIFKGGIVWISVEICKELEVLVKYCPTDVSVYHSEIHRDNEKAQLTSSQCKMLAERAIIAKEAILLQ